VRLENWEPTLENLEILRQAGVIAVAEGIDIEEAYKSLTDDSYDDARKGNELLRKIFYAGAALFALAGLTFTAGCTKANAETIGENVGDVVEKAKETVSGDYEWKLTCGVDENGKPYDVSGLSFYKLVDEDGDGKHETIILEAYDGIFDNGKDTIIRVTRTGDHEYEVQLVKNSDGEEFPPYKVDTRDGVPFNEVIGTHTERWWTWRKDKEKYVADKEYPDGRILVYDLDIMEEKNTVETNKKSASALWINDELLIGKA